MQKNKQELEILRHKVEHFQTSGGGSGDSYTKAQTNALLSAKADKSDTYTKAQTNSAISSAIGDVFADDPIVFVENQGKIYFPTDKVDILRLHKPFMYEDKVWYCTRDEANYGWIYFTTQEDNLIDYPVRYIRILEETKEVTFDQGYGVLYQVNIEDPHQITVTGGTLDSNYTTIITYYYLGRCETQLDIDMTFNSNITSRTTIIEFNTSSLSVCEGIVFDEGDYIIGIKNGDTPVPLRIELSRGLLSKIIASTNFDQGDTLQISIVSDTPNFGKPLFFS